MVRQMYDQTVFAMATPGAFGVLGIEFFLTATTKPTQWRVAKLADSFVYFRFALSTLGHSSTTCR